ncbi:MAG TPA: hypothetical protein VGX03_03730 [Candidatus Binatia bacterium]|jgi:hypothetical protein|nr:hypothetical protein [Candidatus Binatia bacterium]
MPHPPNSEVQIPIPFDTLVRAIDQLPTEALSQLLHAAETALAARAGHKSAGQMTEVEDERFWESELGQYVSAEADASIAIEEVRKALSVISGSLAAEISRERDER